MINYNKNKLINTALDKYYETFSHTLDTADFVPEKFNEKILNYIFKNMKKAFKRLDKEDKLYQKQVRKKQRLKVKQDNKRIKAERLKSKQEQKRIKKEQLKMKRQAKRNKKKTE